MIVTMKMVEVIGGIKALQLRKHIVIITRRYGIEEHVMGKAWGIAWNVVKRLPFKMPRIVF